MNLMKHHRASYLLHSYEPRPEKFVRNRTFDERVPPSSPSTTTNEQTVVARRTTFRRISIETRSLVVAMDGGMHSWCTTMHRPRGSSGTMMRCVVCWSVGCCLEAFFTSIPHPFLVTIWGLFLVEISLALSQRIFKNSFDQLPGCNHVYRDVRCTPFIMTCECSKSITERISREGIMSTQPCK